MGMYRTGAAGRVAMGQLIEEDRKKYEDAMASANKRAGDASLWGSIGRLVGSVGAPALAGMFLGPMAPALVAAAAGAGSLAGSHIGMGLAPGDLPTGSSINPDDYRYGKASVARGKQSVEDWYDGAKSAATFGAVMDAGTAFLMSGGGGKDNMFGLDKPTGAGVTGGNNFQNFMGQFANAGAEGKATLAQKLGRSMGTSVGAGGAVMAEINQEGDEFGSYWTAS